MQTRCYLSQLRRCMTNTTFITRVYNLKFYQQNVDLIFIKITQRTSQITMVKNYVVRALEPWTPDIFVCNFYVTIKWRPFILIIVFIAFLHCKYTSLVHYRKSFTTCAKTKSVFIWFECLDCNSELSEWILSSSWELKRDVAKW